MTNLKSKTAGRNPAVSTNNETGVSQMYSDYSSIFCAKLLCETIMGVTC
jgi:hypothetical protein